MARDASPSNFKANTMTWNDLKSASGRKAIGGYLLTWGVATAYLAAKGADWSFPIISLVIFGVTLSAIAWGLTRKIAVPVITIANPRKESLGLLAYIAIYALVFLGWGMGALKEAVAPGQMQELATLAYKLAVHVALPVLVILFLGGAVRPLLTAGIRDRRWWIAFVGMSIILFGLLAMVSPAMSQIAALKLALPATLLSVLGAWLWISLEAGLCEEFLFRAILQTRLAAWLKSPVVAIVLVSLVFALAHWPGLYFRGTPETDGFSTDAVQVAAFTIAALSPISVLFGVLWQRTRSLLLVALLHGAVDALPFTAEFVKLWG
jgi:uncharacterized protein